MTASALLPNVTVNQIARAIAPAERRSSPAATSEIENYRRYEHRQHHKEKIESDPDRPWVRSLKPGVHVTSMHHRGEHGQHNPQV